MNDLRPDDIKALATLLSQHRGAVVLTGAGASTESGIPDFRSPGTGLWTQIDPMEYLSTDALFGRPEVFWQYFAVVFGPVLDAAPNAGHIALAKLEASGYINAVITQNIDGLHQKAGSSKVFEIHGHLRTAHCLRCGHTSSLKEAFAQLKARPVPRCPECRGMLRPDTVLFGDPMPPAFYEAEQLAARTELMLVIGSSLTVWPAASLAYRTRKLAIINREPTPADSRADVVIHGKAGKTLEALVQHLGL